MMIKSYGCWKLSLLMFDCRMIVGSTDGCCWNGGDDGGGDNVLLVLIGRMSLDAVLAGGKECFQVVCGQVLE